MLAAKRAGATSKSRDWMMNGPIVQFGVSWAEIVLCSTLHLASGFQGDFGGVSVSSWERTYSYIASKFNCKTAK